MSQLHAGSLPQAPGDTSSCRANLAMPARILGQGNVRCFVLADPKSWLRSRSGLLKILHPTLDSDRPSRWTRDMDARSGQKRMGETGAVAGLCG